MTEKQQHHTPVPALEEAPELLEDEALDEIVGGRSRPTPRELFRMRDS